MAKMSFNMTVIFLLISAIVSKGYAGDPNQVASSIEQEYEVLKENLTEELQFLKEQTEAHQKYIENERTQHREFLEDMYNKIVWFAGAVVTIAAIIVAIFVFFGFQKFKDIEDHVEQLFHKHAIKIINQKNEAIKLDLEELGRKLDREIAYKKKRVLIFAEDKDQNIIENREIPILERRGITDVVLLSDVEQAKQRIQANEFDAVVHYYNVPKEEGKEKQTDTNLDVLSQPLLIGTSRIPLIIYNYKRNRVNHAIIDEYPYAVMANFPTTLVNLLHTVLSYSPVG